MTMKRSVLISFLLLSLTILPAAAQEGPQLPNMGFDDWHKSRGAWLPYPSDASASEKVWDSSNKALSLLRINSTTPEYEHVAVPGKGKAAAKIVSRKVLWAFVAGNIFTGNFVRIVDFSGAELNFGVPFTARPTSMSGYYHYTPGIINYAKAPYENLKGSRDNARIEVQLTDWKAPNNITTNYQKFPDGATDPHIIGRGVLDIAKGSDGYVYFEIQIDYRSDATPSYVNITATPSLHGDYFTGADGSVLYIDELEFHYR